MDFLTLVLISVFPVLAIVAGLYDLTTMKIPNWISGLLIVTFFPAAWLVGMDLPTVAAHVGVGLLAAVTALALGLLIVGRVWVGRRFGGAA